MIWTLSDGTTVHLGGKVDGDTELARTLRRASELAKAGTPPYVSTLPPPGDEALRLDDAWHVRCWVHAGARLAGVYVIGEPDVQAPAEWSNPLPDGPDAIY